MAIVPAVGLVRRGRSGHMALECVLLADGAYLLLYSGFLDRLTESGVYQGVRLSAGSFRLTLEVRHDVGVEQDINALYRNFHGAGNKQATAQILDEVSSDIGENQSDPRLAPVLRDGSAEFVQRLQMGTAPEVENCSSVRKAREVGIDRLRVPLAHLSVRFGFHLVA